MTNNVFQLRRVKHGEPSKLKVLVEDFSPRRRPVAFVGLVCCAATAAFAATYWLA